MTPEEQDAKTSVEQALFGLVVPTPEEQLELDTAAREHAEASEALVGDLIVAGESDDNVGKPLLQGSIT